MVKTLGYITEKSLYRILMVIPLSVATSKMNFTAMALSFAQPILVLHAGDPSGERITFGGANPTTYPNSNHLYWEI